MFAVLMLLLLLLLLLLGAYESLSKEKSFNDDTVFIPVEIEDDADDATSAARPVAGAVVGGVAVTVEIAL